MSVNKYPYISRFVDAMQSINAHEFVTSNDLDLKSLFIFFKLYVNTCRTLKLEGVDVSKENIDIAMQIEYEREKTNLDEIINDPGKGLINDGTSDTLQLKLNKHIKDQ